MGVKGWGGVWGAGALPVQYSGRPSRPWEEPPLTKARIAALTLPLALVSALSAKAQEAKPFLVPVSLHVQQVEVVLGPGQGAKGYPLPPAPAGLVAQRGPKDTLLLWVGHGQGKIPLSEWTIQAHLDGQGLLAIPRGGKDGVKKVEGGSPGALVPAAGPSQGDDGLLLAQGTSGGRLYSVSGGKATSVAAAGRTGAAGVAHLGSGTLLLASPGSGGEGRLYLSTGDGRLFALAVEGLATGEVPREVGVHYKVRFVAVRPDQEGAALAKEAADKGAARFLSPSAVAADPRTPGAAYFATLGGEARDGAGRHLDHNGRVYRLELAAQGDPARGGTLRVLLDGSEGVVSPAALAADGKGHLLIGEAPTFPLPGRDTSLWLFEPGAEVPLMRLAEVSPKGAGRKDVPGVWALGGVAEASSALGPDWWLLSLQARDAVGTGQVLALKLGAAGN